MTKQELLTKKFILVGMNDAKISTEEKTIIGTDSLATCIGVLLYSEEKKLAIVAHVAPGRIDAVDKIFAILIKNKLLHTKFKYLIIPGYYQEHYNTKELIEKHMTLFTPFDEKEIPENAIKRNEYYTSNEFAFDASTGKFATNNVLFGKDYYMINQEEYNGEFNINRHK